MEKMYNVGYAYDLAKKSWSAVVTLDELFGAFEVLFCVNAPTLNDIETTICEHIDAYNEASDNEIIRYGKHSNCYDDFTVYYNGGKVAEVDLDKLNIFDIAKAFTI